MAASRAVPRVSKLTRDFCAYIADAPGKKLPAGVAEKTKHHILDTIAAMVTGADLKVGRIAIGYTRGQGGAKEALVVGTKLQTSAVNAALANGMLAHADETDDSHQPGYSHPGCVVVPAALAMAERHNRSGEDLLRAVALGYDILVRVNKALGPTALKERGHGPYSIGGAWGAAAAAGAMAGFDAEQMRHLISNVAQQTSGIATWMLDAEHTEKAFHFGGMPARNGVAAATMIDAGFTGVPDVLTCPRNFLFAYSDKPKPRELLRELGRHYEIMDANIKKWSVGSPIQAAMDSTQILLRQNKLTTADIDKVVVQLPGRSATDTVADRTMPSINLSHCVALMLVDGNITFESTHDYSRLEDPQIKAMKRRISMIPSAMLERARIKRQAIVEIRTKDGRKLKHRTYGVKGTRDNPMKRADVDAKCDELLTGAQGKARARKLINRIWTLEKLRKVRDLRPLLSG